MTGVVIVDAAVWSALLATAQEVIGGALSGSRDKGGPLVPTPRTSLVRLAWALGDALKSDTALLPGTVKDRLAGMGVDVDNLDDEPAPWAADVEAESRDLADERDVEAWEDDADPGLVHREGCPHELVPLNPGDTCPGCHARNPHPGEE